MTDTAFGSLIRKFKTERDGLLHLELYFGAFSDDGTAYVAFEDEDENKVVSITPKNGKWVLVGAEEKATTVDVPTEVSGGFKTVMDIDLDNRTAHLVLNNTDCGTVKIGDGDISRLVLGTEKKGKGYIKLYNARLSKNYALSEHFIAEGTGDAPPCGTSPAIGSSRKPNPSVAMTLSASRARPKPAKPRRPPVRSRRLPEKSALRP